MKPLFTLEYMSQSVMNILRLDKNHGAYCNKQRLIISGKVKISELLLTIIHRQKG